MPNQLDTTKPPSIRAIAFYLPQFHPIPENDDWWGKDFTEWVNVRKGRPLFPGHYQPHVPTELGYYQLPDPALQEAQANLAREHGVHGFCYYHYWFNGKQLLEKPVQSILLSGKPDFPFCLCWANENWTRRWDGKDQEVLIEQRYSEDDDIAHIKMLLPIFKDPRYIRVNNKPLFLIYRADVLPDVRRTTSIWRNLAKQAGFDDLYLAFIESRSRDTAMPHDAGFDAAVEFAPDWTSLGPAILGHTAKTVLGNTKILPRSWTSNNFFSYEKMVANMLSKTTSQYRRFRGLCPSWDNSARRQNGDATVLVGATPKRYEAWLSTLVADTSANFEGDERLIFINAWNEWAEGCHLEPDEKYGRDFLAATKRALTN